MLIPKVAAKSTSKRAGKTAAPRAKTTKSTRRKSAATSASTALRNLVTRTLDNMKAEAITALDISTKSSFADYMIVASGRSQRHVSALADDVVRALKAAHYPVLSVEGQQTGDWVLIDAGSVIAHIFRPEIRQFYNIESMWAIPAPTRS